MPMSNPQEFDALFAKVKARFDQRPRDGLICKRGFYRSSAVLKLQKASWTNDPIDQLQNVSGIFFCIWISAASISKNRVNYNIHALKLRQLNGYSIASRDFASDFRNAFASMSHMWPNVGVDHGPLTLMEGWIAIDASSFENDILALMDRFELLTPLIDRLLESRKKAAR